MRRIAVLAALLIAGRSARAQIVEDSTHLARGIVGFELAAGPVPGVVGFVFSSPTTSWLLGIDRVTVETPVGAGIARNTLPGFRLGVRKWPSSMTGPFKLFVGAGMASADVDPNQNGVGDEFGYGELGSVLFLGHHFSVNAGGELSIAYGKEHYTYPAPSPENDVVRRFFVRGTRLRLGGAVYLF